MIINERLENMSADEAKDSLKKLIGDYIKPAFGSLPKREIDLLMFGLLLEVGVVSKESSMFELMKDLRITRAKAQSLVYDLQVRSGERTPDDLDKETKATLGKAKVSKDGGYFVVEIEDPLLQGHIRERVRKLGHVSDTSFNSSIIRLSLAAFSELASVLLNVDEQEAVRKALVMAGATDTSFKGVFTSSIGKLAGKVAGKGAEAIGKELGGELADYLGPVIGGVAESISTVWVDLLGDSDDNAEQEVGST